MFKWIFVNEKKVQNQSESENSEGEIEFENWIWKLNLKTEVAKRGNDDHVSDFPEIGRVFVTAEKWEFFCFLGHHGLLVDLKELWERKFNNSQITTEEWGKRENTRNKGFRMISDWFIYFWTFLDRDFLYTDCGYNKKPPF